VFSRLIAGDGASEVSLRGWRQTGTDERHLPAEKQITAEKQMGNN